MATVQGHGIPSVKLEGPPDTAVKSEPVDVDMPSAAEDDDEDKYVDEQGGDLEFGDAQQQLWLSRIPRALWETLLKMDNDDEIEIGTIRIEGPHTNPSKVSLHLQNLPNFSTHHKQFILRPPPKDRQKLEVNRPSSTYVFSEADIPGYKPKTFSWEAVDSDGNAGQGRSFLYERQKRDLKRREARQNNERFTPYARKAIPKKTALRGTIQREYEAVPAADDPDYARIEALQQSQLLAQPKKEMTEIISPGSSTTRPVNTMMTTAQRQAQNRLLQQKRQQQKDNRTARVDRPVLIEALLEAFKLHRIWGLRTLREKLEQPEAYLREVLGDIAFMHRHGDWSGKWELKDEYKRQNADLLSPTGGDVAPKEEGGVSDMDVDTKSGVDSGGEDEDDGFDDA